VEAACWVLVWLRPLIVFYFFEALGDFKPFFCVGFASSLAKFGFVWLACATLTMCLQIALAFYIAIQKEPIMSQS